MKNPFKKLSREAKGGIVISLISLLFFGSVAAIGVLANKKSADVNINSLPVPVNPTSSVPPSSEVETSKDLLMVKEPIEDVNIVRYFFDISYDQDDPKLRKAIYQIDGVYHQSQGFDYALEDDEDFDVFSASSGVVESVLPNDRIYGNIVVIKSDDLTFTYTGIDKLLVKVDQKISIGDKIATSGVSSINGNYDNALHFEIRKSGVPQNPEKCFNRLVSQI